MSDITKTITFIEFDIPKLKAGEYTIFAEQKVNQGDPGDFKATRRFGVAGVRFKLDGDDLVSVFPPALANGEFHGVFPNVVLKRPVLPWLRTSVASEINAPWLAVLTLQDGEVPLPAGQSTPIKAMTAADLIPDGASITIAGAAPTTAVGKMPVGTVSCPGLAALDYGEQPTDPVNVIDLPVDLFSRIAPTSADLPMLAHIRQTDTYDSVDSTDTILTRSIVLGNRMGAKDARALALLVSLENMGDYLPDDQGNPSSKIPAGTTTIRLIVLTSWNFFVNALDEKLETLLENLDKGDGLSTVRLPAPAVAAADVNQALELEASHLSIEASDVLVRDALAAGYVPLDHQPRLSGNTVSWYRGPLLPYGPATSDVTVPVAGADALLRYDPYTGMFDASYAAAWQLGQLVGLASNAYSTALYTWKQQVTRVQAAQAEQDLLAAKLIPDPDDPGSGALPSFIARRAAALADPPPIPQTVANFIGGLRLLKLIPFPYLVPDERMLPPESLRIFSVDPGWIEALVDGAFSIGRNGSADLDRDAQHLEPMRLRSSAAARGARTNDRPAHALLKANPATAVLEQVTGVLIRSQAIRGWPKLQIEGYSTHDDSGGPDVAKLRMVHLSKDVLLCLFDGTVAMITIHEPPEQLHSGVEFDSSGNASTTLREVTGDEPGHQYDTDPAGGPPIAAVPLRADKLTMQALSAATSIQKKLNDDFHQGVDPITANEFALEMVKGVVRVEYPIGGT
jgi:hypothetical protein